MGKSPSHGIPEDADRSVSSDYRYRILQEVLLDTYFNILLPVRRYLYAAFFAWLIFLDFSGVCFLETNIENRGG